MAAFAVLSVYHILPGLISLSLLLHLKSFLIIVSKGILGLVKM